MLVADILHSCRHEGVAAAAVSSIGGDFAIAMRAEALRSDLSVGALMASLVSRFAVDATERDWRDLMALIAGEDLPLLSGLRHIAERMLEARCRMTRLRPGRPKAAPASLAPAMIAALAAHS